jgi:hypothetical protein
MSTQPEDKQLDDALENPDDQYWQIPENTSAELHCLRIAFETMTQCAHDHDAERRKYLRLSEELLEAAKLALQSAESWIHDQLDGTSSLESALAELEPVRAAIAKATGDQE